MEHIFEEIKHSVDQAQSILLITDLGIDGDTIGTTTAWYQVLKNLGKDVVLYCPRELPPSLKFTPASEFISFDLSEVAEKHYDLAISCDSSRKEHVMGVIEALKTRPRLINIDHHAVNSFFGDINLVEVEAASTGDVLYRYFKYAGYKIDKHIAQSLLIAICTDTNMFYTSNTTHACIDAAKDLVKKGAKLHTIVQNTMMNLSPALLRLWGRALERLHMNSHFNILTTAVTKEDLVELGLESGEGSLLSEFLCALAEGHEAVLVLLEDTEGGVKGSLRSVGLDISKIAIAHGGGGHKKAAGFYVENAHLEKQGGDWVIVRASL